MAKSYVITIEGPNNTKNYLTSIVINTIRWSNDVKDAIVFYDNVDADDYLKAEKKAQMIVVAFSLTGAQAEEI